MDIRVTPTHTFTLDQTLETQDKLIVVDEVLNTIIELDELVITVEDYFRETWNKENTRICLDMIGYYLSKSYDNVNKHDKQVMSWGKEKQIKNGNSNYTPFSSLNNDDKFYIGIKDYEEDMYE